MNTSKKLGLAFLAAPVGLLGTVATGASAAPLVSWAPYASCIPAGAVGISLTNGTITARAETGHCGSNALGASLYLVVKNPAGAVIASGPVAPILRWYGVKNQSWYQADSGVTVTAQAKGRYQACARMLSNGVGVATPERCADLIKA